MHAPSLLDDERVHDHASRIAHTLTSEERLRWMVEVPDGPARMDATLAELGVPSPALDDQGLPVPGCVTEKLILWTLAEYVVERLIAKGLGVREVS